VCEKELTGEDMPEEIMPKEDISDCRMCRSTTFSVIEAG
jgi:hypothetical protein